MPAPPRVDVVVIGAGIVGAAITRALAQRGLRVSLLDRREIAGGATQASAGALAPYIEAHQGSALRDLGASSLATYDAFVAGVVEDTGLAVPYGRPGTVDLAFDDGAAAALSATAEALAAEGLEVEWLDGAAVAAAEPSLSPEVRGGLVVATHGFVGAQALTRALVASAAALGAIVEPGINVMHVRPSAPHPGLEIGTDRGTWSAAHVVLASGAWAGAGEIEGLPVLPVTPVRGQLLRLLAPTPSLFRVIWSPGCYVVPWADGSLLIGATVEHVGFDERATARGAAVLLDGVARALPTSQGATFERVRVGLRPMTPDHVPLIGPSAAVPGLVYATGHYRNGVLLAPWTAEAVARLIVEGTPVDPRVSPSRFPGPL
jgi:glycine oxidase